MADYRAIAIAMEAVVDLLRTQCMPEAFGGKQLKFDVYQAKDFAQPMQTGVSVFLYQVCAGERAMRNSPGMIKTDDRRAPQMSLDLHLLVTAWAQDANLQHTIAAWTMRTLHENPVLPPERLNQKIPDIFHPNETIEILQEEIETETLFHIWKAIVKQPYEISLCYMLRKVRIE
jgi:hypothetical protein